VAAGLLDFTAHHAVLLPCAPVCVTDTSPRAGVYQRLGHVLVWLLAVTDVVAPIHLVRICLRGCWQRLAGAMSFLFRGFVRVLQSPGYVLFASWGYTFAQELCSKMPTGPGSVRHGAMHGSPVLAWLAGLLCSRVTWS
jgi:hypothetical protein